MRTDCARPTNVTDSGLLCDSPWADPDNHTEVLGPVCVILHEQLQPPPPLLLVNINPTDPVCGSTAVVLLQQLGTMLQTWSGMCPGVGKTIAA
jgi:hypothetical protein